MIISGNTFRSVLKENHFSCQLDLFFDNCTGVSEFGFSGNGQKYKFSFTSGKIFDNENRYFYSYLPDTKVSIQTNFSGASYDYSVDGDKVLYSGSKSNFYAERFYFNTTGCDIDASISIASDKPSVVLNLPLYFYTGQNITGYITTSSPSGVRIFSGYFDDYSSLYFVNPVTGNITSTSSGQFLIRQNVTGLGDFITNAFFDTSAGSYSQQVQISGLSAPFLNYIFEVDESTNTLNALSIVALESGVEKIGSVNLTYDYDTNYANLVPSSLPIDISLSYYSGFTGQIGQIVNVSVISGGNGYLSAPTVIFSGGYDHQKISILDTSTERFIRSNSLAFNLRTGDPISFYSKSGIALPNPLASNTIYYVKNTYLDDPELFTVSATKGGSLVDITNTGGGYFFYYNPEKIASGIASLGITSLDYSSVASVEMTSFGSGYTSLPTIIFSGGTGIINNLSPTLASGVAQGSFYTKTFTGFFNLSTGFGGDLIDYRLNNFISGTSYKKTGVFISDSSNITANVNYTTSFDDSIMVAKLVLSGINNNVIEKYITGAK